MPFWTWLKGGLTRGQLSSLGFLLPPAPRGANGLTKALSPFGPSTSGWRCQEWNSSLRAMGEGRSLLLAARVAPPTEDG